MKKNILSLVVMFLMGFAIAKTTMAQSISIFGGIGTYIISGPGTYIENNFSGSYSLDGAGTYYVWWFWMDVER